MPTDKYDPVMDSRYSRGDWADDMINKCPDDWHLSWKEIMKKYGYVEPETNKHYNCARTCPTCKEKRVYGD